MAGWFPMKVFRRMTKERMAEAGIEYEPSYTDYEPSDMDSPSWG